MCLKWDIFMVCTKYIFFPLLVNRKVYILSPRSGLGLWLAPKPLLR